MLNSSMLLKTPNQRVNDQTTSKTHEDNNSLTTARSNNHHLTRDMIMVIVLTQGCWY